MTDTEHEEWLRSQKKHVPLNDNHKVSKSDEDDSSKAEIGTEAQEEEDDDDEAPEAGPGE